MKTAYIILAIVLIGVLLVSGAFIGAYNSLVSGKQNVNANFSQVRNEYQRQSDLIPNVINTVQTYMQFEAKLLENITASQTQWQQALNSNSQLQQDQAGQGLSVSMGAFLATTAKYPDLKSSSLIQTQIDELEGAQNRITVARMRYIDSVQSYDTMVQSFPMNLVAGMFGFSQVEYYQGTASTAPPVVNMTIGI